MICNHTALYWFESITNTNIDSALNCHLTVATIRCIRLNEYNDVVSLNESKRREDR